MVWRTRQQPPITTGSSWLPPAVIPESLADREARLKREEADRQAMEEIYARQWQEDMEDIAREKRRKAKPPRRPAKKAAPERSVNKGSYQRRATEPGVSDGRDRVMHERSTARLVGQACRKFLVKRGMRLDEFSWQRAQEAWKTASGYHTPEPKARDVDPGGSTGHASDDGTTPIKESLT